MSYQPPPPPGGSPPPPPPGQWGTPPGGGQPNRPSFDAKTVNPLDWAILAAGALAFIFSFVSYYTYGPFSESAWHGFFGWFAMLAALVGSAAVAVELFSPQTRLPIGNRLLGLGAYAVATLCVILALFIYPDSGFGVGHGVGYWISLIVIIAGLVLSLMRLQQTGGQLPGALANMPNVGSRAGGRSQQHGTPPQQGYAPPPQQGYAPPSQQGYAPPPQQGYGTPPPPPGSAAPPPPPPGYGPPQ